MESSPAYLFYTAVPPQSLFLWLSCSPQGSAALLRAQLLSSGSAALLRPLPGSSRIAQLPCGQLRKLSAYFLDIMIQCSIHSVEHQHVGQAKDGSAGRVAAHNS